MSLLSPAPAAPRRKRSARFIEIAAVAGVSETTVNRVLNERGSVSPETRARVIAAARQLGVPRVLPDPRHGLTRFDVVMARSTTPYAHRLDLALQRIQQMLDPRILIHRHIVDGDDERRVLELLAGSVHRRDGLIVALRDSPAVRTALQQQLARGVPVVALMSGIGALEGVREKTQSDPATVLKRALDNVRPALEVRSRRVGGATYQVPVEVRATRAQTLAMRWLVDYARQRREKTMTERLMNEILDASNGLGAAVKRREDTHKMAESNKAFAHYRW